MAMLQVNLLSRYSDELKARVTQALIAVTAGLTRIDPAAISVRFQEVRSDSDSEDRHAHQPDPGSADPALLVRDYLMAMEQRDLDTACTFLAENFVMVFPGSGELTPLSELVEWSRTRYRHIKKSMGSVNVAYEIDKVVVFVNGTLSGEWPDGSAFDSVRFIDRFEIRNDRLERQDVWNDLANALP